MFKPEKFVEWQKFVERKITIKKNETMVNDTVKVAENNSKLKVLMDTKNGGKSIVCVEYHTEINDKTKNQFISMKLKWYITHLVLEQSLIERVDDQPEKELSYGATIYTKFSGMRTTDSNGNFNSLSLLYGKEEEKLPILIEKKDARKLIELISEFRIK